MRHLPPVVLLCAWSAALAAPSTAQVWVDRSERPYRDSLTGRVLDHGIAGRPMLCRNGTLWTWDGTLWTPVTELPPSMVLLDTFAFDRERRELIALGTSRAGSGTLRTWTFDGTRWTDHGDAPRPQMNWVQFHPALRAVLAFAEDPPTGTTQDWRWNGSAWIALPANQRPRLLQGEPASDAVRGRIVLVAGGWSPYAGETWDFDGATWRLRAAAPTPPMPEGASTAFDPLRARVVRFGGTDPTGGWATAETWEWDDNTWTRTAPPVAPPPAAGSFLAFDPARGRLALFDVRLSAGADWEWDGARWSSLPSTPPPSSLALTATDLARGRLVRLAGDAAGSTWEWDGDTWTRFIGTAPSQRASTMAWDPISGRCVLFGGTVPPLPALHADTWLWNGQGSWVQAATPVAPSARAGHAMAPHRALGGVVLFGGRSTQNQPLSDTWIWAGGTWTDLTASLPLAPPGGPSLFAAGRTNGDPHLISGGELWRWTGSWQRISPSVPPRTVHAFGHDPRSGRPVLTGRAPDGSLDTWEWDGARWLPVGPAVQLDHMAPDPLRGVLMAFDAGEPFVYTGSPAGTTGYGAGCGAPIPLQLAQGLPRTGSPGFRLAALGAPNLPVAFLAGLAAASQPLAGGCTLLVATPQLLGVGAANASGVASLPLPIPNLSALRGVDLFAQSVAPQAQGPLAGLALTAGLRIRIGD